MRNVLTVAISTVLLVGAGRASFADNLTSQAPAQADTAVRRTSTPAAALQPQDQSRPVKPLRGGVVGGVTPPPSAAHSGRLASAWTLDERLANRCDPVKAAERVRGAARANTQVTTQSFGTTTHADIISGRLHPELFLPHELFKEVVADAVFRPGFSSFYQPMAEAAGLPADFWTRLQSLSTAYIRDLREQRNRSADKSVAGRALAFATSATLERQTCHDRALALRAARAAFGPALDHFMYEYVAPGTTAFFDEISDERTLRSLEGGCQ